MLQTLQAGRAFAALAVVVHHTAQSTDAFVGAMPAAARTAADLGYLGVDFFFVLSGFIIYYTTYADERKPIDSKVFLWRRLVRIFVPYLPIGVGMMAMYLLLPGLSAAERDWSLLSSLTLIPTGGPPALSVAWTLQHELVFYLLFALLLATGRIALGLWIWSAMIVAAWAIGLNSERPLSVLFGLINLEFGMGVLAAMAVAKRKQISTPVLLAAAIAAFTAFSISGEREHSVLFGAGIAFTLVPLCRAELAGRIDVPSGLVLLGNASYALYLIHNPLLSITSRAVASVTHQWWINLLVGVLISVIASLAYHLLFERWALRTLNSLMQKRVALVARPAS